MLIDEFLRILRDDLGLYLSDTDVDLELRDVAGWDSVHLLSLCTLLERRTGRELSLPEVLTAPTLASIYHLAVR
ncbi:acyl carrier protein [Saccharothrix obliqua]|uniref:acyl carrier protein n=1 Tax=Saccharothrix obliqua TaxID=2861747 RepID=UPI001C5EA198|nr:acyl carrier protein [Saccharothrix obliqua]MBW4717861.1 acyl carrier protein [Saccharothrix obliqua]